MRWGIFHQHLSSYGYQGSDDWIRAKASSAKFCGNCLLPLTSRISHCPRKYDLSCARSRCSLFARVRSASPTASRLDPPFGILPRLAHGHAPIANGASYREEPFAKPSRRRPQYEGFRPVLGWACISLQTEHRNPWRAPEATG